MGAVSHRLPQLLADLVNFPWRPVRGHTLHAAGRNGMNHDGAVGTNLPKGIRVDQHQISYCPQRHSGLDAVTAPDIDPIRKHAAKKEPAAVIEGAGHASADITQLNFK
jgi:hypothetical protein